MVVDKVTVPFLFLTYHKNYEFLVESLYFFLFIVLWGVFSEFLSMFFAFTKLIRKLLVMGEGEYIAVVFGP